MFTTKKRPLQVPLELPNRAVAVLWHLGLAKLLLEKVLLAYSSAYTWTLAKPCS